MGKIIAYIMRENKSVKRKKIPHGDTQFKYGTGKYYLQDRGCFLKGKKIFTFYFENIPYPISFDSFKKISVDPNNKNKDNKELKAELQIDSSVIKDMTEKDLLNSLTETTIEKTQILLFILVSVSIIVGVVALSYGIRIAQFLGI